MAVGIWRGQEAPTGLRVPQALDFLYGLAAGAPCGLLVKRRDHFFLVNPFRFEERAAVSVGGIATRSAPLLMQLRYSR